MNIMKFRLIMIHCTLAELEIFCYIKERAAHKMVILINNRLYNRKIANYIYVMKEGRIAEEGNFEQLIQHNGIFTTLYDAQKL